MAYYNWADYRAMGGTILPTGIAVPVATVPEPVEPPEPVSEEVLEKVATGDNEPDNHLRSSKSVIGYDIQARDGKIGHVEDFIVDDQTWMINYMIVDTRNWLPGKKVIISPHWVEAVHWAISEVKVDLLKETVENSPEYDPSAPINQDYEDKLYDYYGRPKN